MLSLALFLLALVAALGLSVDIGRLFLNKNEAQTFADSAVLDAARRLDGTLEGLEAARSAIQRNWNSWDFGARKLERYQLEFASDSAPERWLPSPVTAQGMLRVRLTVSVLQTLFFLPAVVSSSSQRVVAQATAAQVRLENFFHGLSPLAVPVAGSPPHFGLLPGEKLSLRETVRWWGDRDPAVIELRVLTDDHGNPERSSRPVRLGQVLPLSELPKDVEALFARRSAEDSDAESSDAGTYYEAARGNGRRLLRLPLLSATTGEMVGVGVFLLAPPDQPFWIEYTGRAALPNSGRPGAGPAGAYTVKLIG